MTFAISYKTERKELLDGALFAFVQGTDRRCPSSSVGLPRHPWGTIFVIRGSRLPTLTKTLRLET